MAGLHTGITLWYRWPMLAAACMKGGSCSDPELSRMVSEKTGALMKGAFDAQREALRLMGEAATGRLKADEFAGAATQIAAAGMRPAFRTVRANSRRLSRRKTGS
jgi:hypothetical protein